MHNTYCRINFYKAKLCCLGNVSGFRKKDAPFVLLQKKNYNMFKDLSLESKNIQPLICKLIQGTVWTRNIDAIFR